MKKLIVFILMIFGSYLTNAQNGFSDILAAGVQAADKYANSYTAPASEAFTYNLASGWYESGEVLKAGKFKLQIKVQGTFAPDEKKSFVLDPLEYERIIQSSYDNTNSPPADITVTFGDGSTAPRLIATVLGENNPEQSLIIRSTESNTNLLLQEDIITLAQGIGSTGLDVVPSAFFQVGVGLGAGLEVKARFIPKIETDEVKTGLYGAGLQWEFTKLFEEEDGTNNLPVSVSVLGAFTRLDASYDFEDGAVVEGRDQLIETKTNVFNVAAIASTNFKVINFYGGLNYVVGNSTTDLKGTYTFRSNTVIFPIASTVEDPLSLQTDVSGVLGTIGAKLTLGAFNINADYTFGEYDTASASIFFRI
ncbi:hypothetical protein F0365_01480 [Nonlabens sp. Ci31]|jgi:hypothetical protein|uniref:DUF6588 family protein n=1 Tax=Nonlabens sp. Ci31 TaxID=2608253 RepID=UPI00146322D2|nr:DUF6588 family protein [Nonlabens sp. Ci31]QJP33175.1 hypothetical protein F0365_01480 [Nonlabens sp. Ci31]